MIITYKIEFQSYWHIGSGLSGGADVDALVLKDKNDFPYIPGKTLKGLIREAAELLNSLLNDEKDKININVLFGEDTQELEKNRSLIDERERGKLFFTNATLLATTQEQISDEGTKDFLFEKVASTQINTTTGTTVKHSLREMEVCIPLTLYAQIHDVPDKTDCEKLNNCLKMVKRMGVNRNRGLGRCTLIIVEKK